VTELLLAGCMPAPLASYLKALAALRLVALQADAGVRGRWTGDRFALRTALTADELVAFFLDRYAPAPVVSPWNGGSGFHPKDQRAALERIERSGSPRLASYRQTIPAARAAVAGETAKTAIVARCRATFPDAAVEWLDTALVLMADDIRYPPLLLSGGNDGRLDFSNNFMQRLCDVLPELAPGERERSEGWLRAALFDEPSPPLRDAAVGMFNPGAAGGVNATAGFEGASLVNPWDFVLMIEGTLLFAGAAARRLGNQAATTAAFPFTVVPSTAGVALGASPAERARAELWLPLWGTPSGLAEVQHLCAEGRAEWRRRQARDAVEFAQAVAALGVARGVDEFERFAIHQRMGRSHVATAVGRVQVRRRPEVDLLAEIDGWLRRFRDCVGDGAPAALVECRQRLDRAIFDLCQHGGPAATRAVLVELGRAELALARRPELAADVRRLDLSPSWLRAVNDGSPAFRLSAALGSLGAGTERPLRADLAGGDLQPSALLRRRLLDAQAAGDPRLAFQARRPAPLRDVAALLRGEAGVEEVAELAAALSLVRWPRPGDTGPEPLPPSLPRAYALLALCRLPFALELRGTGYDVPVEPGIFATLAAGRIGDAVLRAARRLRGSGLPVHGGTFSGELDAGLDAGRLTAALLVPISPGAASTLAASVTIAPETEDVR
jgi:CRISPR-associated protein Csx17